MLWIILCFTALATAKCDGVKGQLISKCPFGVIVWTKIPTKKFPRFLPQPLRRGQIKNFIKPIMLNNPELV